MKLISMTTYVLNQLQTDYTMAVKYEHCHKYAQFLKTPLTLGMFVPCDMGNIIDEPNKDDDYYRDANGITENFHEDLKEYQQAKERVIFEGCEYRSRDAICYGKKWFWLSLHENIEALAKYDLTLTPAKAKELGL